MSHSHRFDSRVAFTLVELLVVVLILAILLAIALPLYQNAIQNSQLRTARANMQTIATAEQSFKVSDSTHSYTTDFQKLTDLSGANPKGPGNTVYSINITDPSCQDQYKNTVTVPTGLFFVSATNDGVDYGCYVPGVTKE